MINEHIHPPLQNDEVFTFNLNIIVMDADGRWWRKPISKACVPPLAQAHREVVCEEDYMEVRDVMTLQLKPHEGTRSNIFTSYMEVLLYINVCTSEEQS